jgi:hypothetical protein
MMAWVPSVPSSPALRAPLCGSGLDRPAGPSRRGFHAQCRTLRRPRQDSIRHCPKGHILTFTPYWPLKLDLSDGGLPFAHAGVELAKFLDRPAATKLGRKTCQAMRPMPSAWRWHRASSSMLCNLASCTRRAERAAKSGIITAAMAGRSRTAGVLPRDSRPAVPIRPGRSAPSSVPMPDEGSRAQSGGRAHLPRLC